MCLFLILDGLSDFFLYVLNVDEELVQIVFFQIWPFIAGLYLMQIRMWIQPGDTVLDCIAVSDCQYCSW